MSSRSSSPRAKEAPPQPPLPHPAPGSLSFFDNSPKGRRARRIYLKIYFGGVAMLTVMVFGILSIYWGVFWKVGAKNLNGWIVNFDGGAIGKQVSEALLSSEIASRSKVTWHNQSPDRFPGGPADLDASLRDEETWAALAIVPGASDRLAAALLSPDASYDSSRSILVYTNEARNENAFRNLIRTSVDTSLNAITHRMALEIASQQVASSGASSMQRLLEVSPQTIVKPVGYTIINVIPFDQPVATASTFVGMLYQLILSFFLVLVNFGGREACGYNRLMPIKQLVMLRIVSLTAAFFLVSLFYCLMNIAFSLNVWTKFGHSGFMIFWMVNFVGMLAGGLALESLTTIVPGRFMPFFLLLWVITNLSACIYPIEALPVAYRYGYAVPFYSLSRALRSIIFGTQNTIGRSFGILIAWIALACITTTFLQWFARRQQLMGSPPPTPPPPMPDQQNFESASSSSNAVEVLDKVVAAENGTGKIS